MSLKGNLAPNMSESEAAPTGPAVSSWGSPLRTHLCTRTPARTCTLMAHVHACTCRRVPGPCSEHRLQVVSVSGRVAGRVSVEKEAGVRLCGPWTEGRPEEGMEGVAHLLLLRKAVDSWKPVQTEPSCVSRPRLGLTLGAWRPGWVGRRCHFLYFWDAWPFFFLPSARTLS